QWRGPGLGSWAKVFFTDGRPPMFYWAPLHEHVKTTTQQDGGEPMLAGAWTYLSAMSAKSGQSHALRLAFRITGVVPVDELTDEDRRRRRSPDRESAPRHLGNDPAPGNAA